MGSKHSIVLVTHGNVCNKYSSNIFSTYYVVQLDVVLINGTTLKELYH